MDAKMMRKLALNDNTINPQPPASPSPRSRSLSNKMSLRPNTAAAGFGDARANSFGSLNVPGSPISRMKSFGSERNLNRPPSASTAASDREKNAFEQIKSDIRVIEEKIRQINQEKADALEKEMKEKAENGLENGSSGRNSSMQTTRGRPQSARRSSFLFRGRGIDVESMLKGYCASSDPIQTLHAKLALLELLNTKQLELHSLVAGMNQSKGHNNTLQATSNGASEEISEYIATIDVAQQKEKRIMALKEAQSKLEEKLKLERQTRKVLEEELLTLIIKQLLMKDTLSQSSELDEQKRRAMKRLQNRLSSVRDSPEAAAEAEKPEKEPSDENTAFKQQIEALKTKLRETEQAEARQKNENLRLNKDVEDLKEQLKQAKAGAKATVVSQSSSHNAIAKKASNEKEVDYLKQQIEVLTSDLKKEKGESSRLRKDVNSKTSELKNIRESQATATAALQKAQKELSAAKEAKSKLEAKIAELSAKIRSLESDKRSIESQYLEKDKQYHFLSIELKTAQEETEKAKQEHRKMEAEKTTNASEENSLIARLQQELEDSKRLSAEKISELEQLVKKADESLTATKVEVEKAKADTALAREEKKNVEGVYLEKIQQLELDLEHTRSDKSKAMTDLEQTKQRLAEEIEVEKGDLLRKEREIEKLRNDLKNHEKATSEATLFHRTQVRGLEEKISSLTAALNTERGETKNLKQAIHQQVTMGDRAIMMLREYTKENVELKERLTKIVDRYDATEKKLRNQGQRLEEEGRADDRIRQQLANELGVLSNERGLIQTLMRRIDQEEELLATFHGRKKRVSFSEDTLDKNERELEDKGKTSGGDSGSKNTQSDNEKELHLLRESLKASEQHVADLQAELRALKNQRISTREIIKSNEPLSLSQPLSAPSPTRGLRRKPR